MTVQELRDRLDNYIKKDTNDMLQLNDVELDKYYYQKRCEERANREVILIDDGMLPKYYSTESCFGTKLSNNEKVFAIIFDHYIGKI